MGCCTSKKSNMEERRRIIDHFMPTGPAMQPRFTYRQLLFNASLRAHGACRLEKVEDVDMEKLKTQSKIEARSADLLGSNHLPAMDPSESM